MANKHSPHQRRRVSLYVDEAHNVLTPAVATMLAEGRSAGLEACFAWQYSAQVRDELVRSGVRSLLQSISIFRMRELEDARSLAGLAMDVYSDHISIDQPEQERLRFSADDIIHLPIHTAINLWVAQGTPRAAFVARTLPMEELYDPGLAQHHLEAQRSRGGHHLTHLAASLGSNLGPSRPSPRRRPGAGGQGSGPRTARRDERRRQGCGPATAGGPLAMEGDSYRAAHRYDGAIIQRQRCDDPEPMALRERDLGIVRDVWRYHFLTTEQLRELWWSDRSPQAARRRLVKLFRGGYLERFRPYSPRGSYEWTYYPRRARTPLAAPELGAIDVDARFKRREVFDYGRALHDLQVNAWVLAYRRLLGPALLEWRGEHQLTPPRAARLAQRPLDEPWSIEGLRDPQPRPVVPDAALKIADHDQQRPRTFLIEYDRTSRTDKNFDKFRRYDNLLGTWWRDTQLADDGDPPYVLFVCQNQAQRDDFLTAPTKNSPATAGTPATPLKSTSTSAADESSSATNATSTTDASRRDAYPLPARTSGPARRRQRRTRRSAPGSGPQGGNSSAWGRERG